MASMDSRLAQNKEEQQQQQQQQEMFNSPVALIVGVTDMVGLALAEALKQSAALGGPWKVYGSARRPKPTWFSHALVDLFVSFDVRDFEDTSNKLSSISHEVTHVFWVAIQVLESEEANVRVNQAMLANVIHVLRSSPGSRLTHITLQTGTQHYMGPVHDSAYLHQLKPHETPFIEGMPRLPYPNFYYQLEDLVASHVPSISFSVHRSSIIIGASARSMYNSLVTLAVYASICRHDGLLFRYSGTKYTWEHFCDMTDARVLAEQHIWAAVTPNARNQAFNCTNGDVFTWKRMWKVLSGVFGVEFVDFNEEDEFDFVGTMKGKGKVWEEIVKRYGLCDTKLEEITCFEAHHHVLHFKFQYVCSMNKSREFGFFGFVDTLKSVGMWVERLRSMKIVP